MIQFIEGHRATHGVEPVCRVLPITPATFYDHLAKRTDPSRLLDRAKRDEELKPEIERVFEENLNVYGVRTANPEWFTAASSGENDQAFFVDKSREVSDVVIPSSLRIFDSTWSSVSRSGVPSSAITSQRPLVECRARISGKPDS